MKGLRYEEGMKFIKDASYIEFLDRVHKDELALRSLGLWEVPHPWLNLFVPKSRIGDFDSGVFRGIIQKRNLTSGVFLFYPMFKTKYAFSFPLSFATLHFIIEFRVWFPSFSI